MKHSEMYVGKYFVNKPGQHVSTYCLTRYLSLCRQTQLYLLFDTYKFHNNELVIFACCTWYSELCPLQIARQLPEPIIKTLQIPSWRYRPTSQSELCKASLVQWACRMREVTSHQPIRDKYEWYVVVKQPIRDVYECHVVLVSIACWGERERERGRRCVEGDTVY